MKTTAAIIALASAVSAQNYMHVMSVRSGSPIQYAALTASGQKIYAGGETASYCPEVVEAQGGKCPPGDSTTFIGGDGYLSMGTVVPGGQRVYIDGTTGAVQYTQAHSGSYPDGAIFDGWSVEQNVVPRGGLGRLSWKNGLLACPNEDGKYQVFAQVEGLSFIATCLGFDALFSNSTEASAWQYT